MLAVISWLALLVSPHLALATTPWLDFATAHGGTDPAALAASVGETPEHGLVVHDGRCAYAEDGVLGCFAPTGGDLACSDPVVLSRGVVWLHLHRAVYVPFAEGAAGRVEQSFPGWLFAGSRLETAAGAVVALWGMADGARQELWTWDPEGSGAAARALAGPAAMSGGVSAWPGAPQCLALAYYVPAGGVCEGRTEVVRWCAGDASASAPLASWQGCSGRIVATHAGVWNVAGARHATLTPWGDGPAREIEAPRTTLGLYADQEGALRAALFDGRVVTGARLPE